MIFKAAIRAGALKTVGKGTGKGSIAAAESHAKRQDPIAKKRSINKKGCAGWSKSKSGLRDYVDAFKEHKRETGAGERKNAALALELKVIISPEWFAEDGADPHDWKNNPRIKQALSEAKKWAESWGGKGSVWASRYDMDEKGSGVVDIFMSPVREQRHKNGTSKLVISCRKAKEELLGTEQAKDAEIKNSGAAMQSSWARWCQEKLNLKERWRLFFPS